MGIRRSLYGLVLLLFSVGFFVGVVYALVVTDSFNYPVGDVPAPWTQISGDWDVEADARLHQENQSVAEFRVYRSDVSCRVFEVEAVTRRFNQSFSGSVTQYSGLLFKVNPSNLSQYYVFAVEFSHEPLRIPKNKTFLRLWSYPDYGVSETFDFYDELGYIVDVSLPQTLRVVVDGSNVQAYHNGTIRFSVGNAHDRTGYVGFNSYTDNGWVEHDFDDFYLDYQSRMAEAVNIAAPYAFAAISIMSLSLTISVGLILIISLQSQDVMSLTPAILFGLAVLIVLAVVALPVLSVFLNL